MKVMALGTTLLLLTSAVFPAASAGEASPIGKVLQLLSDLQTKIIGEGEEAMKTYAAFSEWCEERSKNLGYEIKTGKSEVADLKSTIEEETAIASSLESKIEKLAGSIATDEADLKAATVIRAKEAADFAALEKELTDVIDTLERAIGILEKEMQKSGASMVQLKNAGSIAEALSALVKASAITSADAKQLTALVQSSEESEEGDSGLGAPDAAVYKGQSRGIISTLEDLLEKAEGQLADARKTETADLHNFEVLKLSLEDEIKYATKEMAEAKQGDAASGEKKATAEGDLKVTSSELKEDITTLADLHQTCMAKAQDFEAETKSRGEELQALASAKKAIKENTAGADTLTYGLNQVAFVQLSSGTDLARYEAVRFVRDLARKQNAPELAQLAARMASATQSGVRADADPFAKVKGLIADMIERLEDEADKDASHKAAGLDKAVAEASADRAGVQEELDAVLEYLKTLDKACTEVAETFAERKARFEAEIAGLKEALQILEGEAVLLQRDARRSVAALRGGVRPHSAAA